jgi:hypothetical protein
MRRSLWDTFITAAVPAILVLIGWIWSGGLAQGKQIERIDAIEVKVQTLERTIAAQLMMLSDGQAEIKRQLEVIQAEQRILHRNELGRLSR